ncbi:hypothetical protein A2154_02790 [Candidatus Gottesmanbacteria bacterium RBG_16_43_7]|uniref:Uncharacterized protein n=1 Tax=Candidatus Gottesmanbacteria bacterium RBG_16_43_7 TaxID=1798373 RepID=A0A1F5ZAL9_9BACT|nr:MAG: hypothetical protein A2154_02790 [Candidatus Gottesmanbacteria bacterium RBG_16_43_7]
MHQEIIASQPSQSDIEWNHPGLDPLDTPPNPRRIKAQSIYDELEREDYESAEVIRRRANRIWELEPPISRFIRDAFPDQEHHLTVADWQVRPIQLDFFILLLSKYHQTEGHEVFTAAGSENLPSTVRTAFERFLAPLFGCLLTKESFRWDYTINSDDRKNVPAKLLETHKLRNVPITAADFDVCVLTALACGNPFGAAQLIQTADQFFPGIIDSQRVVIKRLSPIFGFAYQLSPDSVRNKYDGVLASFGKGALAGIKLSAIAQKMQQIGERRLIGKLTELRNAWYQNQQIVPTELRLLSYDTVRRGPKEIKEFVTAYVDGMVANTIAAEIQNRLLPELRLSCQIKQQMDLETDLFHSPPVTYELTDNYFESTYSDSGFFPLFPDSALMSERELTYEEKADRISQISLGEDDLKSALYRSIMTDYFKFFVGLLKDPDLVTGMLKSEINSELEESGSLRSLQEASLDRDLILLGQRLISLNRFLQTITQEPVIKSIIAREFGLTSLIKPKNLKRVDGALKDMFHDQIERMDPVSGSVAAEIQAAEDLKTARSLALFRYKERTQILQSYL